MTQANSMHSEMARFWNESGGRRWSANIERVERMLEPLSAALLEFAAPRQGEQVLDVGCGGGLTSKAFADAVGPTGAVTGLDVSAVILEVARARFGDVPNLRFVQEDAGSTRFAPASLDLVTSRFGVMFFPAPVDAFRNLRTALKPEGRLRFVCWQALALNPWMRLLAEAAFTVLPRPEPTPPNAPGPFGLADETYLRGVLAGAGFGDIEVRAHRVTLDLGPVEAAVQQMTQMGPAAQAFEDADDSSRERVCDAMRAAVTPHAAGGTVRLDGATWLVAAAP
ncbi:MAG: class I SAM-dependent methyltransferase [Gammaproteobacteria bacterium]